MAPTFRNFLRMACETLSSVGAGVGGALATFRGKLPPARSEAEFAAGLPQLNAQLTGVPAVTAVHCAGARSRYSDVRTSETELRPQMNERPFDVVLIVEGVGLTELERDARELARIIAGTGLTGVEQHVYDMAFLLGRNGGS
jgi:hypothetical protein